MGRNTIRELPGRGTAAEHGANIGLSVLPAERVYICAATKQACVEPEFRLWGRPHIHRRGRRTCESCLIGICGADPLLAELEQPTQAHVIATERV